MQFEVMYLVPVCVSVYSSKEMLTGQRLCHSKSHQDSVLSALNQQRKDGQLCDVTLVAGEHKFHAHKAVLAACSDYFRVRTRFILWSLLNCCSVRQILAVFSTKPLLLCERTVCVQIIDCNMLLVQMLTISGIDSLNLIIAFSDKHHLVSLVLGWAVLVLKRYCHACFTCSSNSTHLIQ